MPSVSRRSGWGFPGHLEEADGGLSLGAALWFRWRSLWRLDFGSGVCGAP